jgi:hypothetical protein
MLKQTPNPPIKERKYAPWSCGPIQDESPIICISYPIDLSHRREPKDVLQLPSLCSLNLGLQIIA